MTKPIEVKFNEKQIARIIYKVTEKMMLDANRIEVVRCEDCKYAEQCHKWIKFKGVDLEHRYNTLQFCSFGERKEINVD